MAFRQRQTLKPSVSAAFGSLLEALASQRCSARMLQAQSSSLRTLLLVGKLT